MLIQSLLLILGLALLTKGADWLVHASASLAKKQGTPPLAIGLTVVAFGTSVPELVVNVFAAINNQSNISLGNIVGSNIINILIILGLSVLFVQLSVTKTTRRTEIPIALAAAVCLLLFSLDGVLSRLEAVLFALGFFGFLWYIRKLIANHSVEPEVSFEKGSTKSFVLYILLGLSALFIGGKITVDAAINLAQALGISEFIISVTVVALGTSLPELMTSLIAAYKKHADIAVGNIIGSNIFNILFIMATTMFIRPIQVMQTVYYDMIVLVAITLVLWLCTLKGTLSKRHGITFLCIYVAYIIGLLIMQN